MSEWQPIETAPRDGQTIWVASSTSLCPAYFAGAHDKCWRNWFKGCRYENARLGSDHFLPERIWFEPTHWQPLPAPPMFDQRVFTPGPTAGVSPFASVPCTGGVPLAAGDLVAGHSGDPA